VYGGFHAAALHFQQLHQGGIMISSHAGHHVHADRGAVRFRALLALSGLILSIVIVSPEWVRAALAVTGLAVLMIFRIAASHYGWARRGIRRAVPRMTEGRHVTDEVFDASFDSFPASDPPGWTGVTAGPP
jgi:hypothetical protein